MRIERTANGRREIGQNHGQDCQRREHVQRGGGALQLEALLVVAAGAQDEAQPDDAVQHDHDGSVDGVPCHGVGTGRAGQQDGDDQADLDHRDRDGKKDGTERLAKAQREDLGVVDGGEHGSADQNCGQKLDGNGVLGGDAAEFQAQKNGREDGNQPRPCRRGIVRRRGHSRIRTDAFPAYMQSDGVACLRLSAVRPGRL